MGKALRDKVAPDVATATGTLDQGNIVVHSSFTSPVKRLEYFNGPLGTSLRIGNADTHHRVDMNLRSLRWCALCDQSVSFQGDNSTRHVGSKSSYACLECGNVVLCKQAKFSQEKIVSETQLDSYLFDGKKDDSISCWDIWHTSANLQLLHDRLVRQPVVCLRSIHSRHCSIQRRVCIIIIGASHRSVE